MFPITIDQDIIKKSLEGLISETALSELPVKISRPLDLVIQDIIDSRFRIAIPTRDREAGRTAILAAAAVSGIETVLVSTESGGRWSVMARTFGLDLRTARPGLETIKAVDAARGGLLVLETENPSVDRWQMQTACEFERAIVIGPETISGAMRGVDIANVAAHMATILFPDASFSLITHNEFARRNHMMKWGGRAEMSGRRNIAFIFNINFDLTSLYLDISGHHENDDSSYSRSGQLQVRGA